MSEACSGSPAEMCPADCPSGRSPGTSGVVLSRIAGRPRTRGTALGRRAHERAEHEHSAGADHAARRTGPAVGIPAELFALQRLAGNEAVLTLVNARTGAPAAGAGLTVQRLLPTHDKLEEQAGPRKDTRFLVFEMSKTYGNILDALRRYHELLNTRMSQPPQADHLASIFNTLSSLEGDVKGYISKHKEDFQKNLEAKRTATTPDEHLTLQVRLDRYRAIEGLHGRIVIDRGATERAQVKLLKEAPPHGFTWRQFIHPPAVAFSAPPPTSVPTPGALTGSPRDMDAGAGLATTSHRELTVSDRSTEGVAYGTVAPQRTRAVGVRMVTLTVKPESIRRKDPPSAPVETAFNGPAPQLYEVVTGSRGGLEVHVGGPPIVLETLSDSLFIGGEPRPDDVAQTGIGDCFYLAVITSMAARDPATIKSIIKPAGSGVTVTFHRFDTSSNKWVPQTVDLDRKLAFRSGGGLAGAMARFAPAKSRWWAAAINAGGPIPRLEVYQENVFEAALWAPLLEKAYARFAQDYHVYGDAPGAAALLAAIAPGTSGYDVINEGGLERMVYGVLYGSRASTGPGQDQAANLEQLTPGALTATAVKALLQMKGHGLGKGETMHVTASISKTEQVRRAKAAVDTMYISVMTDGTPEVLHLRNTVTDANHRLAFRQQLLTLSTAMHDYLQSSSNGDPADVVSGHETTIGTAAHATSTTAASWTSFFYPLQGTTPPPMVPVLLEHLAAVLRLGPVPSSRMFVFANHAYTVMDVSIIDRFGQAVSVNDVDAKLAEISLTNSTVVLRNPHRGNAPNPTGMAEAAAVSGPGTFQLTLEQFLRHFGRIDFGRIAAGSGT